MDSFIHHRVFFIGDAAHQVSPFGARGANGALQSVENLGWKLAAVIRHSAPPALLRTYDTERQHGARENILNSTRATDFMTPKNAATRLFRDTVLDLARHYPFARALVNSGRLSVPCTYEETPLNTPDSDGFAPAMRPGSACIDAPVSGGNGSGWLLNHLGNHFTVMVKGAVDAQHADELSRLCTDLTRDEVQLEVLQITAPGTAAADFPSVEDKRGVLNRRYDLSGGGVYLIRPDQHVAARWRALDASAVAAATRRALGYDLTEETAA